MSYDTTSIEEAQFYAEQKKAPYGAFVLCHSDHVLLWLSRRRDLILDASFGFPAGYV